jgi:hypothetical protein
VKGARREELLYRSRADARYEEVGTGPTAVQRRGARTEVAKEVTVLAHHDRGWSTVRESLRRERRINDVLNASHAARLSKRVAVAGVRDRAWRDAERDLRTIEHSIRRLDPIDQGFWDRYADLERQLVSRFADAGITFRTE